MNYAEANETDLRQGLKWSVFLHLGFVFFVFFKIFLFPDRSKPYVPTLRVDLVDLPDVLKKDLPTKVKEVEAKAKARPKEAPPEKPATKTVPAPAPPTPAEMAIQKKKSDAREKQQQTALDRIKALSKISGSEDVPPAETEEPSAPIKGNILSKGTSTSGDAKELGTGSYYDVVLEQVRTHWTLPVWLSRQELSAQVEIFLNSRGQLQGLKFKKTSGNPQFDDAVRHAIGRSQPFPPPPEDLRNIVLSDGILLGFPL